MKVATMYEAPAVSAGAAIAGIVTSVKAQIREVAIFNESTTAFEVALAWSNNVSSWHASSNYYEGSSLYGWMNTSAPLCKVIPSGQFAAAPTLAFGPIASLAAGGNALSVIRFAKMAGVVGASVVWAFGPDTCPEINASPGSGLVIWAAEASGQVSGHVHFG